MFDIEKGLYRAKSLADAADEWSAPAAIGFLTSRLALMEQYATELAEWIESGEPDVMGRRAELIKNLRADIRSNLRGRPLQ